MVNYNNGKIYKIEALTGPLDEKVYIGSTTKQYLSQRMEKHRGDYKRWKEGKGNKIMSFDLFDKYGVDNCAIVLIELVNATCKDDLLRREAYHIKETNNKVNKVIPIQSLEDRKQYEVEYAIKNKDKIKEYKAEYQIKNKDKLKQIKKEYYEANKEILNQKNKERTNKEDAKERARLHRLKNNFTCTCQCGSIYVKYHETNHMKTKKHQAFIIQNN
jgi:Fe2+ transport system protein B